MFFVSQISAAYVLVKAIDAAVHTTSGFFYNKRSGSSVGDIIAVWEIAATATYLTWSLLVSIVGYISLGIFNDLYEQRVKDFKKGVFGVLID